MQLISTERESTRHTQFVFLFFLSYCCCCWTTKSKTTQNHIRNWCCMLGKRNWMAPIFEIWNDGERNDATHLNAAEQECAHFWLYDQNCIEKFGNQWTMFGNTFQTWISFACIHSFYPLHRNSGCAQNLCNTISVQSFSNFARDTRAHRCIVALVWL